MRRNRARGQDGASLAEVAVTGALLLAVTASLMVAMSNAQTRQREAADSARAAGEGRVALDLVAKEVRQARRLTQGAASTATAWVDTDEDGAIDDGEEITFSISNGDLSRSDGTTRRVLVDHVHASSTLNVRTLTAGSSLEIDLVISYAASGARPVTLHMEVMPRVQG